METIFIQEADQLVREVLTIMLQEEGYGVIAVTDITSDHLKAIDQERAALVLLDFKILGEDAIRNCKMIKNRWPAMPVIAMSCNHNIKDTFINYNFDGYIEKPFDMDHLLCTVGSFLIAAKTVEKTTHLALPHYITPDSRKSATTNSWRTSSRNR